MALRSIRQHGDYILQKKAKPVQVFDGALHGLLDDMLETLRHYDGLGMAAPQVGILRRVIVIEAEGNLYEIINPEIVETVGQEPKTEACLSVPNKQGEVQRPTFVKVDAFDRYGNPYSIETEDDLLATALCHEIDHLDGVLFIEKATKVQDRPPDDDVRKARRSGKIKRGDKRVRNRKTKIIRPLVEKMAAGGTLI